MIGVNTQTVIFLQSLLLGAALGALYDIFRILRLAVPTPSAVVFVEDLLYFALCAAATFLFMMNTIYGSVRVFVMLGELIGWILYYLTVGAAVMRAAQAIIRAVRRVLRLLYRLCAAPLIRLFGWVWRKLGRSAVFLRGKAGNFSRNLKIRLKRQRTLLYNQSNNKGKKGKKTAKPERGGRLEKKKKRKPKVQREIP